jgi:hypothetical protein
MPNYGYKDKAAMAYDANKKRIRAEGAIVLAAAMNEALNEMTRQFNEALHRGEILEIEGSREEMKALLLAASQKELAPGADES